MLAFVYTSCACISKEIYILFFLRVWNENNCNTFEIKCCERILYENFLETSNIVFYNINIKKKRYAISIFNFTANEIWNTESKIEANHGKKQIYLKAKKYSNKM